MGWGCYMSLRGVPRPPACPAPLPGCSDLLGCLGQGWWVNGHRDPQASASPDSDLLVFMAGTARLPVFKRKGLEALIKKPFERHQKTS